MGLFKRVGDILSANFNELVEKYENPEKLLKQAVREMEASIATATTETARAVASRRLLDRELAHNEAEARRWQERARQAVAGGDDDRARRALHRKQEHDRLAVALRDQVTAAEQASRDLRRQLDGMKAKLAEARRSLGTLAARRRAAELRKTAATSTSGVCVGHEDGGFAKFNRLRDKVEFAEALALALTELQGGDEDDAAAAVALGLDVEAQLQELKRQTPPAPG